MYKNNKLIKDNIFLADIHKNEFGLFTGKPKEETKSFDLKNIIPSYDDFLLSTKVNKYNYFDETSENDNIGDLTIERLQSNYEISKQKETSEAILEQNKNIIQKEFYFTSKTTSSRTKMEINIKIF